MQSSVPENHPLRALFRGLVEQVFMTEIGICDPRLTDYLSRMLADFVHIDAIYRLRTVDGEVIRDLSRAEAEAYLGPDVDEVTRRRLISRYVGDFTLFWTGVYPESLRGRRGRDRLGEFVVQGRRGYSIASELSDPESEPAPSLLQQLSEEFENCIHGLHLVREGWRVHEQRFRKN